MVYALDDPVQGFRRRDHDQSRDRECRACRELERLDTRQSPATEKTRRLQYFQRQPSANHAFGCRCITGRIYIASRYRQISWRRIGMLPVKRRRAENGSPFVRGIGQGVVLLLHHSFKRSTVN